MSGTSQILKPAAILLLLFISVYAHAQCPPQGGGQNEIGVRLLGVTNGSNIAGRYDASHSLNLGYLNGIHYKRYADIAAFRAAVYVDHIDYEPETMPGTTYTDAKATTFHIKAGGEVFSIMGMVEPYAALDVHVSRGIYNANVLQGDANGVSLNYRDERGRTGYGLSPAAGLRIFAGYGISFSAETSLDCMAFNTRMQKFASAPEDSEPATRTSSFRMMWNPVSWLSMNVLF